MVPVNSNLFTWSCFYSSFQAQARSRIKPSFGAGVTLVMAAQSMTEADTAWGRLESLVLCWGNLALAAGLMYATHQSFPKHLTWLWDSNLLVAAWIVLPLFVSLMSLFNVYGKKIDTV